MRPETTERQNPKLVADSLKEALQKFGINEIQEDILSSHKNYFLFKNNYLTGGEYKIGYESTPPTVVIYKLPTC